MRKHPTKMIREHVIKSMIKKTIILATVSIFANTILLIIINNKKYQEYIYL